MKESKASYPGKIILIGEHAVVYDYPAVITSIKLFAESIVTERDDKNIRVDVPGYNFSHTYTYTDLLEFKTTLDNLIRQKRNSELFKIIAENKDSIIRLSLLMTLDKFHLNIDKGFNLVFSSQIPIGGFASSSALGASVIDSVCQFFDHKVERSEIFELLIEVETLMYGGKSPSGADQTAVVYGGLVKYQKVGDNKYIDILKINSDILNRFVVIYTGTPENTTGEVVAYVRERYEKQNKLITDIFNNIEENTENLLKALDRNDRDLFYKSIDNTQVLLKELGIVREPDAELIAELNKIGVHAKVSGAGAITGKNSGAIICFTDDYEPLIDLLNTKELKYFIVSAN